jgi:hypothetical protein
MCSVSWSAPIPTTGRYRRRHGRSSWTEPHLKFRVFCDVAPCSHVEVGRRFRGAYCLHHHGDDGVTYQKTLNFILAAVRALNLTWDSFVLTFFENICIRACLWLLQHWTWKVVMASWNSLPAQVDNYLITLTWRSTPYSQSGRPLGLLQIQFTSVTPCELFFSRLRFQFNILIPSCIRQAK